MIAMAFSNSIPYSSTTEEIPSSMWTKTKKIFAPLCTISFLKVFLGGQALSLLICGTGVTSQILNEEHGVNAPTTQSFANYLLLAVVYCPLLCLRKTPEKNFYNIFMRRWWVYLLIALVDVEANYLVVKAYHYTTLTSIQLLDCITIPVVILLSFLVLRVRYRAVHVVGVVVCIAGLGALIGADVLSGRSATGGAVSNKLLGDIFCLIGASLYGVTNVAQEYTVRHYTRTEFLGMVGLFATFISGIQLVALERQELATFSWSLEAVLLLLAFAACMFLLYSLFPVVIRWSSATVVNLSILTADMYTLLIGLFVFNFVFSGLYLFGFALIFIGIVVYSLRPTRSAAGGWGSYSLFQNNRSSDTNIPRIEIIDRDDDDDNDRPGGEDEESRRHMTTSVDGGVEGESPAEGEGGDLDRLHKEFSRSLNGETN